MRLTKRITVYPSCDKQGNLTKVDCIEIKNKGLAEEKLCQLEDIEDELGIDLITLFKALKNGFYYKDVFGDIEHISKEIINSLINGKIIEIREQMKQYGKTWALIKEELE